MTRINDRTEAICPACGSHDVNVTLASPNDGSDDPEYYACICNVCEEDWEV